MPLPLLLELSVLSIFQEACDAHFVRLFDWESRLFS